MGWLSFMREQRSSREGSGMRQADEENSIGIVTAARLARSSLAFSQNPPNFAPASMVSAHNADGAAPRPFSKVRYELLTLGDELLLGLTANGHLTFIGAQLGRRGALLQRNVTITDEADAIARAVSRELGARRRRDHDGRARADLR